jgi:hypothetical protein
VELLNFEIYSPKYLGSREAAEFCINILKGLPKSYWPTKCRTSSISSRPFQFEKPESFFGLVPGKMQFDGDVSLYKTKNIFKFWILWSKGDKSWFENHPTKPFNIIGFETNRVHQCINNPEEFVHLKNIWLNMCIKFKAVYAYIFVQDATSIPKDKGFGFCIPRLHWITLLGKEYCEILKEIINKKIEGLNVSFVSDAAILEVCKNPFEISQPNEFEKSLIMRLGEDIFWSEGKWNGKPRKNYRIPNIDWSDIFVENG